MHPLTRAFMIGLIIGFYLAFAIMYLVSGQPVAGFALAYIGFAITALFERMTRPKP